MDSETTTRPRPAREVHGFTLVEMVVTVALFGVVIALAMPGVTEWSETQRTREAARSLGDLMSWARGEALRTGDNHIVFFGNSGQTDPSGNPVEWNGNWKPLLVINDGDPATADCAIDAGEIVQGIDPMDGVSWGVSHASGRVGTDAGPAPFDPGGGWDGATFGGPTNAKVNWVLFRPDGVPVTFTGAVGNCGTVGSYGTASGALYVTNDRRDFAVVLTPLGATRLHSWDEASGGWTN